MLFPGDARKEPDLPLPHLTANASRKRALWAVCLFALGLHATSLARPTARTGPAKAPDVLADFAALAQQTPWQCKQQTLDGPQEWGAGFAQCAWQDRLRMRRWEGPGGEGVHDCVSAQARWWAWARGGRTSAQHPAAWDGNWTSQALIDDSTPEQRTVIIERLPDGHWRTTEWRWNPSPRSATRRWQEGRWAQLTASAMRLRRPPGPGMTGSQKGMMRAVLLAHVGARVAEIGGDILNYRADGLCIQVDAASPGQQQIQVPYSADDSRLEQRAAMQLQLARRFPKAAWLTPFSLIPASPNARGGAKFYAVWLENAVLKGQLWIPTRSDGPLVRVRLTTALDAVQAGGPDAPAVAAARRVLERELMGVASTWASQHE